MRAGKPVGMEVCGATDVQECWDLVDAYERTFVRSMVMVPIGRMEATAAGADISS